MLENCLCLFNSSLTVGKFQRQTAAVYVKPDVARRGAAVIRNYHYMSSKQLV